MVAHTRPSTAKITIGEKVAIVRWLLIDKLEECDPGKHAVAVKVFPRSDLMFMDHFPGQALVPGVLEIEMIAQTAAACVRLWRPKTFAVLSTVHSARFLKPIRPGDQCRVTADIVKMRPHYVLVSGYIEVGATKVGEAEILAAVVPGVVNEERDPVIEEWLHRPGQRVNDEALWQRESDNGAFVLPGVEGD